MCGRYELITEIEEFPLILKRDFPKGFRKCYEKQELIKPGDPIIVLKDEGKVSTSLMLWGFIPEWAKSPLKKSKPRPFNARIETVEEKKLFRGSWRYKRCVFPASAFFEKDYKIRKKDGKIFWLAGIWNKWISYNGREVESCCVLTTYPNRLIKTIHNRMPVIIPQGLEESWIAPVKSKTELRELKLKFSAWDPEDWEANRLNNTPTYQMHLF